MQGNDALGWLAESEEAARKKEEDLVRRKRSSMRFVGSMLPTWFDTIDEVGSWAGCVEWITTRLDTNPAPSPTLSP